MAVPITWLPVAPQGGHPVLPPAGRTHGHEHKQREREEVFSWS